ncbi:glycosyl transferase family 2 [Haloferax sp. YSSS75]|uniref:glycosyl transferase family 2 n=1 Tax=Haloferax sp. YSSS75 TaxID=3388564 RepID=UPI00398C9211
MEYVQERVTTLHDLSDPVPDAPIDRAAVVVPMTEREYAGLAAERVLSTLESLSPARVVVPLRAPAERVASFVDWLTDFDLPLDVLWCDGPRMAELLDAHGLDGERGKGRDVWLALGCAAREEYVVVHDADTKTYDERYVTRLLFPLAHGHDFSKGYYARVEDGKLYGRLFRLFYAPLVRTLAAETDAPVVHFLESFRYALAGEFATTSDLATKLRLPRSWGLEVGTLGDAFTHAGFERSAQVDLGAYEHDHRAVSGPTGLSDMSESVGRTLLRTVVEHGGSPDFETLAARYRETGYQFVEQYAADAAFNGFDYDRAGERKQVETYADAVVEPGEDTRLPAWRDASLSPEDVMTAAREDVAAIQEAR